MSPRCLRCKAGSEWIEGSPLDAHANVLLLRAEVRALRRDNAGLRRALTLALPQIGCCCMETMPRECRECRVATEAANKALKPKARRRKA